MKYIKQKVMFCNQGSASCFWADHTTLSALFSNSNCNFIMASLNKWEDFDSLGWFAAGKCLYNQLTWEIPPYADLGLPDTKGHLHVLIEIQDLKTLVT